MDLVKPRALRLGDTIGIVSTSSPVTAKELARLSAQLLARGYNVRKADGLLDRACCRIEFGLRGRQPVLRYWRISSVPLHSHVAGTGRPVVVLPSLSLDSAAMRAAVEPAFLGASGWSRVYLDLPGTGGSPPGEPSSDAVLADVIATVGALLGNEPFLVAGWSYGGYLAAALARRLPERVAGLLMACSGFKIRPADRDLSGVLPSRPEPGWLADVPPSLHEYLSHAVGHQTMAAASRVAAVLAANSPVDEAYFAVLRAEGFALADEGPAAAYEGPAGFVCGRRDRLAGYRGVYDSLGRFPDADYVLAAEAGHFLPVELPGVFRAAIGSWLDRCAGAR